MKFTCVKKEFETILDVVGNIIPAHHSLAVLQCVLLEVKNNTLTVTGTNIETSIRHTLSVEGSEEGVVAVPARVLVQTLHTIPAQTTITCSIEESTFLIESKQGKSRINTMGHEEFPTIPQVATDTPVTLPKNVVQKGLKQVVFSASKSLVKPELSGVFLYVENNELYFVASDSFRLAEKKVSLQEEYAVPDVIIPTEAVMHILRTLDKSETETIIAYFEEQQAAFVCGGTYITFRVVDGNFPDYRAIIPKEAVTTVRMITEDARKALKKAALFSDAFSQVSMSIVPSKNTLTVSARNSTVGESFDSYTVDVEGEELDINFNHRYVSEGLSALTSDSVTLLFSGAGKPLVVHPSDDSSFTYLVMPMNR